MTKKIFFMLFICRSILLLGEQQSWWDYFGFATPSTQKEYPELFAICPTKYHKDLQAELQKTSANNSNEDPNGDDDFAIQLDKFKQAKKVREYYPVIVIYPAIGKKNAERLITKLLDIYNFTKGADRMPRYNARVNSLIFYSQGNSDDKNQYPKVFKGPDKVVYRDDFVGPKNPQDYRLKITLPQPVKKPKIIEKYF